MAVANAPGVHLLLVARVQRTTANWFACSGGVWHFTASLPGVHMLLVARVSHSIAKAPQGRCVLQGQPTSLEVHSCC
jgi:hypothetical protein